MKVGRILVGGIDNKRGRGDGEKMVEKKKNHKLYFKNVLTKSGSF